MSEHEDRRFEQSVEISGYRRELSRRELGMRRRVLECLRDGPKTVPEVAAALHVTAHEAMWWVMGFVRYGFLSPSARANEEGYFTYEIVGEDE